jgi:serine/threonine protein kinase
MMTSDAEDASPKLIDLGLSWMFHYGELSEDRYGTLAFCSPEIILGRHHNLLTDVWSLGVVLHYLISGIIPFLSRDKNQTKKNIVLQCLDFSGPAWTSVSI